MSTIVKLRCAHVRASATKALCLQPPQVDHALQAVIQCRNHDLIWSKSQRKRISQHSICIRGVDMNSTHILDFIPYAILGAGLIIVVSFFPPNGLRGTWQMPTAMWQTTVNTQGDTATRPAEHPNQACTAWLEGWADPAKHEGQLEWILGFVTGSNYRGEGQGQPKDADEVEIFVEHYCRNNPEHQLFMAAAALVQGSGGPAALHEFKKERDGSLGEEEPDLSRPQFTQPLVP
jgi:hypothetical protein